MSWEIVSLATVEYESRLRKAAEARLAHKARHYSHPAPQMLPRLRSHLGQWLVAWGTALQTPADTAFHGLAATESK
jgi:hypothetical protein